MIIRRLTQADVVQFRVLRLRALQEHPAAFGRSHEEMEAQPIATTAAHLQSDHAPHNFVLGAFDQSLVGIVGFVREQGKKVQHKGTVWGMYVARDATGRGIGRALLERLISEVRMQDGVSQIMLSVVSTNTSAQRLYAALGFERYGREPRALKLGDTYFDEDLLVLRLN
ncbi:MAG: GNAT family N-acetyltransferase [Herpetosiphon sp.]